MWAFSSCKNIFSVVINDFYFVFVTFHDSLNLQRNQIPNGDRFLTSCKENPPVRINHHVFYCSWCWQLCDRFTTLQIPNFYAFGGSWDEEVRMDSDWKCATGMCVLFPDTLPTIQWFCLITSIYLFRTGFLEYSETFDFFEPVNSFWHTI